MKFAVGQPVTRIEDTRLITGQGKFTDDQKLPGMVHGVFARSPYAHAKIISINICLLYTSPSPRDRQISRMPSYAWDTYFFHRCIAWSYLHRFYYCLLYTSPSPRDRQKSRMPSSA